MVISARISTIISFISSRKLTLLAKGPACKNTHKPGTQITVRGHAYKITVKGETFFTVREYDIIGSFDA